MNVVSVGNVPWVSAQADPAATLEIVLQTANRDPLLASVCLRRGR